MGIQDRDYYRKEGPSIFDSLVPRGLVCRWLISINVGVWLLQLISLANAQTGFVDGIRSGGDGWVTDWFILDVDAVLDGQVWRLLTHAFLHQIPSAPGETFFFTHLLFNMMFLWWFGSDIEELYGRKEFLAIYLTAAVLGGVTFVAWNVVMHPEVSARGLGASGAVTTMLILCAFHFPRRVVHTFMLIPMPIWLFAVFNIAFDAYRMIGEWQTGRSGGVAWQVHLAGAAFAVAYFKLQWSITGTLNDWLWWRKSLRSRPRLKLFEPDPEGEKVATVPAGVSASAVNEHLEAKCDAILDKISKYGRESLTPEEEAIMKEASKMYKDRRS